MLSLHSPQLMLDALKLLSLDPGVRHVLANRIEETVACELTDLTHLVVVLPGDTEEQIVGEVCFSPLENRLCGTRYGSDDDFEPEFDWIEWHEESSAFELIFTVANAGFAFVLVIADLEGADPQLLGMCRQFAGNLRH